VNSQKEYLNRDGSSVGSRPLRQILTWARLCSMVSALGASPRADLPRSYSVHWGGIEGGRSRGPSPHPHNPPRPRPVSGGILTPCGDLNPQIQPLQGLAQLCRRFLGGLGGFVSVVADFGFFGE
jgi:hypothetical protein